MCVCGGPHSEGVLAYPPTGPGPSFERPASPGTGSAGKLNSDPVPLLLQDAVRHLAALRKKASLSPSVPTPGPQEVNGLPMPVPAPAPPVVSSTSSMEIRQGIWTGVEQASSFC